MRSALIALGILMVTLLSVLAVASPGLGKGGSHGKSGERSVHDSDDDDSGGDSDDDGDEPADFDDGGSGRKADRGDSGKRNDREGSKKKDKSGRSNKKKRSRKEEDQQDDRSSEETPPSAAEQSAPPSSTPGALPPTFDPQAPLAPDGSNSPSNGPNASDGIGDDGPVPPPSVGKRVNVAPQGEILVKLPSGADFVPLRGAASLPNGSLVDARYGSITLTSASDRRGATQTATFRGAVFQILQDEGPRPVTELILRESEGASSCELRRAMRTARPANRSSRAGLRFRRYQRQGTPTTAARKRRGRKGLWGNGRGRFRTRGRHGAASVRGTRWLTEDRCEGTFFRVTRGVVTVDDFARDRTVTLRPGDSYLARLRR